MTQPRLSTIYDFSDLRLHPDGTRVYQKATTNLRPRLVKSTVRNVRENWIARDAGGSGSVPKFRKRLEVKEWEVEEEEAGKEKEIDEKGKVVGIEQEGGEYEQEEEGERLTRRGTKRRAKRFDGRKPKRLKFARNFDYLAPTPSTSANLNANAAPDSPTLPEPSPDLLKAIHKYASEFYTERGQLLNISRQYRKERKKRALRRKAKREKEEREEAEQEDGQMEAKNGSKSRSRSRSQSGSVSSSSSSDGDAERDVSSSSGEDEEQEDNRSRDKEGQEENADEGRKDQDASEEDIDREDEEEDAEDPKGNGSKKTAPKRKRKPEKLYTDMYKMFDGSAMMALGMLVQEHIAHLLTPQIPPGWEEEMRTTYASDFGEQSHDGQEGGEEAHEVEMDDDEEKDKADRNEKYAASNTTRTATSDSNADSENEDEIDEWSYEEEIQQDAQNDSEDEHQASKSPADGDGGEEIQHRHTLASRVICGPHKASPNVGRDYPETLNDGYHGTEHLATQMHPPQVSGEKKSDAEGDDPLQGDSSESMRSDDTVHSDSDGEFSTELS